MDRLVARSRGVLGRLALLAAAVLGGVACQDAPEAKTETPSSASAPARAAPTAAPTAEAPPAIAISDVPLQAERFESLRREITANLTPGPELEGIDDRLSRAERRTARLLERPALSPAEEVQLVELQDLDLELRDIDAAGGRLEAALAARARALDADLGRLAREQARWAATLPEMAKEEAPEPIRARVSEITSGAAALRAEVKRRRDETLTQLDRISRIRSSLEAARGEISDRRRGAQRRLFAISEGPIWHMAFAGRPVGQAARERLLRDFRRLRVYFKEDGARVARTFFLALLVGLGLPFLLRGAAKECAKLDPFARAPIRLIERPFAAATLGALMILGWSGTSAAAPVLFRDAVWVLAILSTAQLLFRLLDRSVQRTLYVLTAVSCLYPMRRLFEQDPLLERLVLILQAGAVAATLAADLRAGVWKRVFSQRWERVVTLILATALVLLSAALVLVVIGYVEPARLLRTGVIGSLGFGLISLGLYSLLYGFLSTLLATRPARSLHLVAGHADSIRLFLRRALSALVAIQWVFLSFAAFGLGNAAVGWLKKALESSLQIGSATVSVSGILTFVGVLAGSFLLAGAARFVLEGEILPRLRLPRGLPYTISMTLRYAIIVSGVFLAFSAAGISLSRFTLLAGALGVGLGFGLQNLVSNFVSGLILLFERPIQVGDYVDVGSLVGEVTRIGMRSSTIHTADGAEVVVPNADLISKSVVNWTLSDRKRRIEIRVGAAYGSDPEKVIGLLLQAAGDHPEAMAEPPPAAYFVGLGDSSLDFVLHVWVARFEQAPALQSAVRRAVYRVLRENGIEIPFPQRDLNLRTVSPEASRALQTAEEEDPARET